MDAYSFAIVLWELIHNKLPFEGMSNLQAAYAAAFKVIISSMFNFYFLFFQSNSFASTLYTPEGMKENEWQEGQLS